MNRADKTQSQRVDQIRVLQQEIRHLNRVLQAVRSINQLIVREKDRQQLIEGACECLVEARGYDAAWVALLDENRKAEKTAGRGYGQNWKDLAQQLLRGELPACARGALDSPKAVFIESQTPGCGACSIAEQIGDHQTLATRIEHEGRLFGVMAVSVIDSIAVDDAENTLFREIAGDIAFALQTIENDEALAAEKSMTEVLFAAIPDMVLVHNPHSQRAVRWNKSFREVFGYSDEEIAAQPAPATYLDAGDTQQTGAAIERAINQAGLRLETVGVTKDQRKFTIEYKEALVPGATAGENLIVVIGRDITDRIRSEERIRFLSSIVEQSPDAIICTDRDFKIIYLNPAAEELFGWSQDELAGKSPDILNAEPDSAEMFKRMRATLHRGGVFEGEALNLRRDGSIFHCQFRITSIRDRHGEISAYMASQRDVTEHKNMQAQMAQSDRLASMGMLAAGVAHEINNPLNYVLYNLEILSEDFPQVAEALRACVDVATTRFGAHEWARLITPHHAVLNPATIDSFANSFHEALKGTNRIIEVVRGLSTFSRVEEDRLVSINLAQVIDVAINMVFNEIKYRCRLVRDYGETAPVLANDGRLSQVFLNLLVNATHAIKEGNVKGNEIVVRTWQEGDRVFAEVSDTGSGISAEHLPRLFEPFFTTKEIGFGTGLGLPISRNIIEGYGGQIAVISKPGRGSCFVVQLPARPPKRLTVASPSPSPQGERAIRGRLLLIDDETPFRVAVSRILHEHDVVQAASGDAGKRILERDQAFDLILCDVMMPAMSGVELHEWLTATHPELAKRVVFLTGGAFTPRTRTFLRQVDNLRLEKPFDRASLKRVVRDQILLARQPGR